MSPENAIANIQNIHEFSLLTPNHELITHTLLLSDEKRKVKERFGF
jgi:hypothetical protein